VGVRRDQRLVGELGGTVDRDGLKRAVVLRRRAGASPYTVEEEVKASRSTPTSCMRSKTLYVIAVFASNSSRSSS